MSPTPTEVTAAVSFKPCPEHRLRVTNMPKASKGFCLHTPICTYPENGELTTHRELFLGPLLKNFPCARDRSRHP